MHGLFAIRRVRRAVDADRGAWVHAWVTAGISLAMSCTGGCDLCGDDAKRFDAQDKPQVAAIYPPSTDLL